MGRTFQRLTESRVTPPEYIRRVLRQARRLWPFLVVGVIAAALIFDLRGHGESGGTRYTLGIDEPRDILSAIDLAARRADIERARVAVIGESLGGGSVLMTVQADPTIGPVVTDSAFADGNTVVSESATKYTNLPAWFTPAS